MNPPRRITLRLTPDQALDLPAAVAAGVPAGTRHWRIERRSVDARGRNVVVQVAVLASDQPLPPLQPPSPFPPLATSRRAVVVGAGPAGLMAAWALRSQGVPVTLLEQGEAFPDRHAAVKALRARGDLAEAPPLTCGLGGAGTYSDGKLYTRKKGPLTRQALALMAHYGHDPELLVEARPHVGSNRLPGLVDRLRTDLAEHDVTFRFASRVAGLMVDRNRCTGVVLAQGEEVPAEAVVLAPGNSARALYEALHAQGVAMTGKGLAVGVRVEHPRPFIDRCQYGDYAGHPALGAARYAFAFHKLARPVYSFCMCPGGHLLPTPPEPGHLAVNGMSFATRSSRWSNAAIVAAVGPSDWDENEPLGAIGFQRGIEAQAFAVAGDYRAPAQRLPDFLAGRLSATLPESSYRPGVVAARLDELLPKAVVEALKEGFRRAEGKLPGYVQEEALLVGPETLTSAPVQLGRGSRGESSSHLGLFPCGEGGGWAGGITSSAADGLFCGEAAATLLTK